MKSKNWKFVGAYAMLIDAVIVYPIDVPTRFVYWDIPQSVYLIPPTGRKGLKD
jgi:hypothetical protein